MKALLKAPSPKIARKWFGRRNATTKASATGPVPMVAAITTSRKNPVMREASVHPPTEAILPSIGPSGLHGAAVVPDEVVGKIARRPDALLDHIERPALHLGEDAPDVLADDAERHELHA